MGQPRRDERGFNPGKCPLTAAMTVIGGKWAGVIWYRLSEGAMRSAELRRSIPGISQKMLTEQLRDFERHGVVARKKVTTAPPQVEYRLTPYGESLASVYELLCKWGYEHLQRTGDDEASVNPADTLDQSTVQPTKITKRAHAIQ